MGKHENDFFSVAGGAERVILLLAGALNNVDLCLGYRDAKIISDKEIAGIKCYELSGKSDIPPWRIIKLMRAFVSKTGFLSGYEWVLFSGTIAPLAVKNHQEGRNLLYCHTIPRFAYDLKDYYLNLIPWWQRPLLNALIKYTRPRYEAAVSKMDTIMVNSENVRKRLKTYKAMDVHLHPGPIPRHAGLNYSVFVVVIYVMSKIFKARTEGALCSITIAKNYSDICNKVRRQQRPLVIDPRAALRVSSQRR